MTSAAGQNFDFARAQKYTKIVYADKVNRLIPEDLDIIAKDCSFVEKDKQPGDKYYEPVQVSRATGVTFNNDGSAFTLNKGLASKVENAELRGSEILLRDFISYAIMNRAMSGDMNTQAGRRAFVSATKETFLGLAESGAFFRESMLLYGGGANASASLATIESTTSSTGTTLVVVVSTATWATSLWVGNENAEYDIYNGSTQINTAGTAAARDNVFVLTSVDPSTRTLTFTSNATNVTAAASAANYVIFFAGQRTKDMVGIQAAFSETTLWNISTSTYALWKPQSLSAGGQLTFEVLMAGCAKIAEIGYHGTINQYVSPRAWQDLIDDQAALIRHTDGTMTDKKGGTVRIGATGIEYVTQTGTMKIKAHKLIKNGFSWGLPDGECMRIGSTDLTFEQPGFGKMISDLPDQAGVQARIYTDQAFFCRKPKAMLQITGITNSR